MIAISCAVRGGQLNLACGPFLVSYLHRGFGMSMRDVRLVQGVIFRTYFQQFAVSHVAVTKEAVVDVTNTKKEGEWCLIS